MSRPCFERKQTSGTWSALKQITQKARQSQFDRSVMAAKTYHKQNSRLEMRRQVENASVRRACLRFSLSAV